MPYQHLSTPYESAVIGHHKFGWTSVTTWKMGFFQFCNHADDYYSPHTVSYIGCTGWENNFSVILPFGLGGFLCILGTAYIMGTAVIISMITNSSYFLNGKKVGRIGLELGGYVPIFVEDIQPKLCWPLGCTEVPVGCSIGTQACNCWWNRKSVSYSCLLTIYFLTMEHLSKGFQTGNYWCDNW